jgi:hypothetical protein
MKDGADVHILQNPMPNTLGETAENWRGKLLENAKAVANMDGELDGYVLIGLFSDGCSSVGYRLPGRIPECLAAAYVGELIRRDTVVENEAERTFDRKFEWVE